MPKREFSEEAKAAVTRLMAKGVDEKIDLNEIGKLPMREMDAVLIVAAIARARSLVPSMSHKGTRKIALQTFRNYSREKLLRLINDKEAMALEWVQIQGAKWKRNQPDLGKPILQYEHLLSNEVAMEWAIAQQSNEADKRKAASMRVLLEFMMRNFETTDTLVAVYEEVKKKKPNEIYAFLTKPQRFQRYLWSKPKAECPRFLPLELPLEDYYLSEAPKSNPPPETKENDKAEDQSNRYSLLQEDLGMVEEGAPEGEENGKEEIKKAEKPSQMTPEEMKTAGEEVLDDIASFEGSLNQQQQLSKLE